MFKYYLTFTIFLTIPSYWAKPEHTLDLSRYLNDHIAQIVSENPTRFVGLGTLPMQAPDLAVKELRRCVQDLGLAGTLSIHIPFTIRRSNRIPRKRLELGRS